MSRILIYKYKFVNITYVFKMDKIWVYKSINLQT